MQSTVTLTITNPFANKPLRQVLLLAEGRRLAQRSRIALGDIPPGGTAVAEVAILPRPRVGQPLASPHQNTYQLALTLQSAEVRAWAALCCDRHCPCARVTGKPRASSTAVAR